MKKVAVVLSGCGVMDGSEIHEAVACLYALSQKGVSYQCLAPDILQKRVVNHLTNEATNESRYVLVESARIARGDIKALASVSESEFSAAIYPGGLGAALNLCDFALSGSEMTVEPSILYFAKNMAKAGKPQGFACIAPVMIPRIYGDNVKLTIGDDQGTAEKIIAMKGEHVAAKVSEVVTDNQHKVASAPAYMKASTISEVFLSINNLVEQVLAMIANEERP